MSASVKQVESDKMLKISQARKGLLQLRNKDFQEIKSLYCPPEPIQDVLLAAMLLLGHRESEEVSRLIKHYLGNWEESFQQKVADLDIETIPQENLQKAKALLLKYDSDKIAKYGLVVKALYIWAEAVSAG